MHPFFDTLTQNALFLHGEMDRFLTGRAATPLIFRGTGLTLNKQQMTTTIPAIGMRVRGLAALMTTGDDLFADTLAQAVVTVGVGPLVIEEIVVPKFPHSAWYAYSVKRNHAADPPPVLSQTLLKTMLVPPRISIAVQA